VGISQENQPFLDQTAQNPAQSGADTILILNF
jgi:hypothetical protein